MGNRSIQDGDINISINIGSGLHFDHNISVTMTDLGSLSVSHRYGPFDASEKAMLVVRV